MNRVVPHIDVLLVTTLSLALWALFLGVPVFVGHRHGFGLGCLTAVSVFLAGAALGRLAFPERA